MTVVTEQSNIFRNPHDGDPLVDPLMPKGRVIFATGTMTNLTTDNTNSTYRLAELPSDCMLHPDTFFGVASWGFAQVVIGTKTDTTALVNQTKATEAIVTPIAQGDANHGKRLWEVLGLSADPGGAIALFAHAAADATGAGSMIFQIAYIYN